MRRRTALTFPAAILAACAASPPHPRAIEQVASGYAHLSAGDRERAEVAFEHALEMAPELAEARAGLAVALRSAGRAAEALRQLDAALEADPDLAEAHAARGEALLALGRSREGEEAIARALSIDPDQVAARIVRARVRSRAAGREAGPERRRLLDLARRDLLHALEARPGLARIHADLGWVAWLAGDLEGAARSYAEAVRLEPALAEAQLGACASLAAAGHPGARAACARCAGAAPPGSEASARCGAWLPRVGP
jgi:tetratricopeptide (TPR) repeat protein